MLRVSRACAGSRGWEGSQRRPAITIGAADLPEDVVVLLDAHLLDLGGTYGDPSAGDPIQYDEPATRGRAKWHVSLTFDL